MVEAKIHSLALGVGFDACGVTNVDQLDSELKHLTDWLELGMNGEMGYMERNLEKRVDPRLLVPNAKSVVSVILSYYPGNPDISNVPPRISRYALSRDYHDVLKDKLYQLLELIRMNYGKVEGRAFVDSAPVLERAWAARAGLGWIGKNSMLINPMIGSYFFIGELIIDLAIEPSASTNQNRCGTCTKCIDACPTRAIVSPGVIDSRKCISYLTIEKKSPLTEDEVSSLNGWCFGCDICQEVCPWNSKVSISQCHELVPKQNVLDLKPSDLRSIPKEKFESILMETPVNRAGWERFINNCSR